MFKRTAPWKKKKPTSHTFGPSGFERKHGRWVPKKRGGRKWIDDPDPQVGSDVVFTPPADQDTPQ